MSNNLNSELTIMTMSNANAKKAFANGSQLPSPLPSTSHSESAQPAKDMEDTGTNTNTKDNMTPPPPATETAPAPGASESVSASALSPRARGFDLLFTASQCQVDLKPKVTTEVEADSANAVAEVPSTVTVVSTGRAKPGGESYGESANNCDDEEEDEAPSSEYDGEKPANAVNAKDQKVNVKTFPQVLQIILNTPEYESIAHWLPDGLSFIIEDKQRFSDEILPKYFRRGALFHSFIRKLNRYGFRRVKASRKGEESSFAHNNFVRDKPWLCLKMNCQSKPSYHKVPSAMLMPHQAAATFEVDAVNNNSNRFANAGAGLIAMPSAVSPTLMGVGEMMDTGSRAFVATTTVSPTLMGVGGMMDTGSRAFVATTTPMSYFPAAVSHSVPVSPMTTAAIAIAIGPPTSASSTFAGATATAAAIQEKQSVLVNPMLPVPVHYNNQRILHEMQIRTLQMRQYHQRQVQLKLQLLRLHEMPAYDEDHFSSSRCDSYIQSSSAQCTRDMLQRNIFN